MSGAAAHPQPAGPGLEGGALAAILYATSVAIVMLGVLPAAELPLRREALLSAGQVGLLYGAELAAMGLASLPAYAWLRRADRHRVAGLAYLAFALGNGLSALLLPSFGALALARGLTGLGAGTLMVLGLSAAERARQPDRAYALVTLAQLVSAAAALALVPLLVAHAGGLRSLFHLGALLGLAGLATSRALGAAAASRACAAAAPPMPIGARLLPLAAALIFNLLVSGLWAFAAEFGTAAGLADDAVALALNLAAVVGILGAAASYALAARAGRRLRLLAGQAAVALGALLMLQAAAGRLGFTLGCSVFSFGWNFTVPALFAAVAARDASGLAMPLMNLAFAFGLALGPLLAGALVDAGGPPALLPWALAAAALGMLLLARLSGRP